MKQSFVFTISNSSNRGWRGRGKRDKGRGKEIEETEEVVVDLMNPIQILAFGMG